jgi:GT2 family glycosyltransferase
VSLVVVCHRSSPVLADCVESFRREALGAGIRPEVVAVEQSEDEHEAKAVAALGVDRVIERANSGYAAGLNAGVAAAAGEVLLLANPDIRFLHGSLGAVLRALDGGFDMVGPRLVWDVGGKVLLPVAEDPAPGAELWRTVRRRWQQLWSVGLGGALEESWRMWTADGPVAAPGLRGPLMAVSRSGFERLGPLDEGYFLYYEDTEWAWRARRSGARIGLAADAAVVHRWGHATDRHPDRAQLEEASRRRFFRRNYGPLWRLGMRWCAGGPQRSGPPAKDVDGPQAIPHTRADLWLVSIYSHLIPAVGWLGASAPPCGVVELTEHGRWYCLAAERGSSRWRVLGSWTWERP